MKNRLYEEVSPSRLLSRDMPQIRIAVAGLGKMGAYHMRAIQQLTNGEDEDYYKSGLSEQICKLKLCGLCDPDEGKRALASADVPMFGDWTELLAAVQPDLAVIASPTPTHFDLALAALNAGVHTFVEKPLVTTADEFNRLTETAVRNGCRLMSGHVERYNPVAIKLRTLLAEEKMNALSYRFQRTQPHDARIVDDIVTDKIVHDLDLAQWFFGTITGYRLLNPKRADGRTQEAAVWLRHANGVEGTLFVSWMLPDAQKCRKVRITCKDGIATVGDFVKKTLHINGQPVSCSVPSWVKSDNNQIKDELADFVAYCMIPDSELPVFQPLLQPQEIKASVKIIEALIQDTKEGAGEKL